MPVSPAAAAARRRSRAFREARWASTPTTWQRRSPASCRAATPRVGSSRQKRSVPMRSAKWLATRGTVFAAGLKTAIHEPSATCEKRTNWRVFSTSLVTVRARLSRARTLGSVRGRARPQAKQVRT